MKNVAAGVGTFVGLVVLCAFVAVAMAVFFGWALA